MDSIFPLDRIRMNALCSRTAQLGFSFVWVIIDVCKLMTSLIVYIFVAWRMKEESKEETVRLNEVDGMVEKRGNSYSTYLQSINFFSSSRVKEK